MEIIIINEKKNKTLNFSINWAIFVLLIVVMITILILFIYGVINFTQNKVDVKKAKYLSTENIIIQKEIENLENKIKRINMMVDSLSQGDTLIRNFASLKPLEMVIQETINVSMKNDTLANKNIDHLSTVIDGILLKAEAQLSSYQTITEYLKQNEHLKNSIPSIPPVNGWFMRGFGYCIDPFTGFVKMHEGIDIVAPLGTSIIATADGVVKSVQNTKDFGLTIEINHNHGYTTIYARCQNSIVKPGQLVKRGDIIGSVGTSSKSPTPHLHYEIRIWGVPVDPKNYMFINKTAKK